MLYSLMVVLLGQPPMMLGLADPESLFLHLVERRLQRVRQRQRWLLLVALRFLCSPKECLFLGSREGAHFGAWLERRMVLLEGFLAR